MNRQDVKEYQLIKAVILLFCIFLINVGARAQTVSFTEPDGGDTYRVGETVEVQWSDDTLSDLILKLYRNKSLVKTLHNSVAHGYYNWQIEESEVSGNSGDTYQLHLYKSESSDDGGIGTKSIDEDLLAISNEFYIEAGTLKFTSPESELSKRGDQQITFQWEDDLTEGNLELHYWYGDQWHYIKSISADQNSTTWDIPDTIFGNVNVRIRSSAYSGLSDQINNINIEGFIDVEKPGGGEQFQAGQTMQIEAATNMTSLFRVELDKNGQTIRQIADQVDDISSISWEIDSNISSNPGDEFQIEIYNLEAELDKDKPLGEDPTIEYVRGDISDRSGKFYIRELELHFNTNLGGREILAGKDIKLEWENNLQTGSFVLQYKRDGNWVTIADNLPYSQDSYTWRTPLSDDYLGETQVRLLHSSYQNAEAKTGTFDLTKGINVLRPQADEVVVKDKSHQISWETNVEEDVKIQLLDANNAVLDTIAYAVSPRNAGSDFRGSFVWTLTESHWGYDIEPGQYYKVKVSTPPIVQDPLSTSDADDGDDDYTPSPVGDKIIGISDLFYVDFANYIDIRYPFSTLRPGDNLTVRWATNIETLDIELVGENGTVPIREDYQSNTSDPDQKEYNEFNWPIPSDLSDGSYALRFRGDGSTIVSDNFTIEVKQISLTKPTGGEIWDTETPHYIRWEDNFEGNVSIDLYQNGSPVQTIVASTDSDGSYEWNTDAVEITVGDNYEIVIYDTRDSDVKASSGAFSILNFKDSDDFTLNYVKSQTVKVPINSQNQLKNLPDEDVSTSVSYADGMGKTRQSISVGTSPNGNDVVKFKRYNTIGQEDTTWQPFTAPSRGGEFQSGAIDRQENFYKQAQGGVPKNEAPYATAEYEKSPMLRVEEQGSVGKQWQPDPNSQDGHTVKMDYGTNKPGEVLFWKVDANGNPETDGYYARGQLQVTRVMDENGAISFTYEDKEGNEILKLGYKDNDTPVKTYYVYDQYNNLRYIIPPEASKRLEGETNKTLDKSSKIRKIWLTEFKYDVYDRVVWKKIPEAEPVYTIYDPMGRVILTQDGNQRAKDQWFFTKYDIHGRTIMTGLYTESDQSLQSREQIQSHVNDIEPYVYYEQRSASNFTEQHGYTFNAFPSALDQCDIWTVSWYDDYDFNRDGQPDYNFESRDEFTEVVNNDGSVVEHVPSERTFDKATGGLTRVIQRETAEKGTGTIAFKESPPATSREVFIKYDRVELKPGFRTQPGQRVVIGPDIKIPEDLSSEPSSTEPQLASTQTAQTGLSTEVSAKEGSFDDAAKFLESATFYDKYGNTIYTLSENNLNGTDETWNLYDFSGKVLRTVREHDSSVLSDLITVRKRFEYDHGDRLTRVWQQNNDDPEVLIAQNEYNELGKLIRKSLHSDNDGGIFLQNVDYKWHQRGWLKSVNNPKNLTKAGEYKDLFAFDLFYETLPQDLNVKEQFNGNITGTRWKTADDANISGYSYRYDDLNQIREALYGVSSNGTNWSNTASSYNTSYDYDLNGNMQWAKRRGESNFIDDLSYEYRGNKLYGVDDAVSDTTGMHFSDFGSKYAAGQEYFYDANGNMISDANKGIDSLTYNEMNLPEEVFWADGRKIEWQYTAGGTKLRKKVYNGTDPNPVLIKHYINGYVYRDSTALLFFDFDEGRVRNVSGNLRYEYDLADHLGNVRLTFTEDYNGDGSPDILQREDYYPFGMRFNSTVNGPENKFTYNGKELEDEFGLNWYHYGVRFYDPQLGRWHAVDPMDEFISPYSYVGSNPVNLIDPDGSSSSEPLDDYILYADGTWQVVRNGSSEHRFIYVGLDQEINVGQYLDLNNTSDRNLIGYFMDSNDDLFRDIYHRTPESDRALLGRLKYSGGGTNLGLTTLDLISGISSSVETGALATANISSRIPGGQIVAGASLFTAGIASGVNIAASMGKYMVDPLNRNKNISHLGVNMSTQVLEKTVYKGLRKIPMSKQSDNIMQGINAIYFKILNWTGHGVVNKTSGN